LLAGPDCGGVVSYDWRLEPMSAHFKWILWTWTERDDLRTTEDVLRARVVEVLARDETRARAWLEQLPR
jgi:hypothetical protein